MAANPEVARLKRQLLACAHALSLHAAADAADPLTVRIERGPVEVAYRSTAGDGVLTLEPDPASLVPHLFSEFEMSIVLALAAGPLAARTIARKIGIAGLTTRLKLTLAGLRDRHILGLEESGYIVLSERFVELARQVTQRTPNSPGS